MWSYNVNKAKNGNVKVTHKDCLTCEYRDDCFPLLRMWHRLTGRCAQGRKAPVRVKAKDQKTLDEVKASEGVTDAPGILTPQS